MGKLTVFNNVSLDGYFVDAQGDMSWAHNQDAEWNEFAASNASGAGSDGMLIFGRVTYQMMASFWPTPAAMERMPVVAEQMNKLRKVVFSRTLAEATWQNTTLIKSDLPGAIKKLKSESGPGMCILGSGQIVSQLAQENLIDEYQIVVHPIVLGKGRTLFETVTDKRPLKLTKSRTFGNGNVVLWYEPTT